MSVGILSSSATFLHVVVVDLDVDKTVFVLVFVTFVVVLSVLVVLGVSSI